ncbi:hypothetical protein J3F83DRAFT_747461 [Trichoderma novae-zelandiae]
MERKLQIGCGPMLWAKSRCGIGRAGQGKFASSRNVESNLKGRMTDGLGYLAETTRQDTTGMAWHEYRPFLARIAPHTRYSYVCITALPSNCAVPLLQGCTGCTEYLYENSCWRGAHLHLPHLVRLMRSVCTAPGTRQDRTQRASTAGVVQTPEESLPADQLSDELGTIQSRRPVQAETKLKSPCLVYVLSGIGADAGNGEQAQSSQKRRARRDWMLGKGDAAAVKQANWLAGKAGRCVHPCRG